MCKNEPVFLPAVENFCGISWGPDSFVDFICLDVRKKDPLCHLSYLISLSVFCVQLLFSKLFLIRKILCFLHSFPFCVPYLYISQGKEPWSKTNRNTILFWNEHEKSLFVRVILKTRFTHDKLSLCVSKICYCSFYMLCHCYMMIQQQYCFCCLCYFPLYCSVFLSAIDGWAISDTAEVNRGQSNKTKTYPFILTEFRDNCPHGEATG